MEIIDNEENKNENGRGYSRVVSKSRILWYAIAIIACGVIWIGCNADLISYTWRRVLLAWPMLLIVVGLGELLAKNTTAGVILLAVGAFFELPRLGDVFTHYGQLFDNITDNWWPLLLILAGVLIIVRLCRQPSGYEWKVGTTSKIDYNEAGGINIQDTFGGSNHIYTEPEFRGGSIKVVFGGTELDLRTATLPAGETTLYVEAVFGGVEIVAPADWAIEVRNQSFCGGFTDHRRIMHPLGSTSKLIIVANCVFGGGDIK